MVVPRIVRTGLIFSALFTLFVGAACQSPSKTEAAAKVGADKNASGLIPLEDFFRNPKQGAFELSPDGTRISFLAPYEGRMNIFVQKRDLSTPAVRVTAVTDRDIAGHFWKGNDTLIFSRDFNGDENFQLFAISAQGGEPRALTPFKGVRADMIDDLDQIDEDHVIVGLNKRNPEIFDAYRLNVRDGDLKMIAENPGHIAGWMTDQKGRLRLAIESDGVNNTILVREKETGPFRRLLTTNFRESVSPLFYTFDDKNVYAASNRGRDKSAIVTLDLKSGKEKVVYAREDVDVNHLSYSKKRHVLWAAVFTTWKQDRHFFDTKIESVFNEVRAQLPGVEVGIVGHDRDEKIFTIRASSDVQRGATYIYDSEAKKLTKLADAAPWLKADQMSEMKPIEYKSRDGLLIHGYLTLPKGVKAENLPLIVNPHGGPWVRDSWGFNPEAQFLASRGYAVFQPNYRGSTGYGRKFWEASFKQWGRAMQDDLTDGVKWLAEQKIVDAKRVGIYGGSYGGYATLAGLAFTPEVYACGVDYVGVSNLFTFMNTIPPYWKPFLDEMHEEVGDPKKDEALMRAASPVFHVDQIKAPLFVAQGAKDPRVNIAESNQIVEALRKRGVTVEYMVKDNEGHGFHNEENRFDFYRAMEKFLAAHL